MTLSRRGLIWIGSLWLCVLPHPARGQVAPGRGASQPRLFAGATLATSSTDPGSRMRLGADASKRTWTLAAGLPMFRRLGLGIELVGPSDATGETRGRSFASRGRQRERLLLALARVRAAGTTRWGVDAVGGMGVLFQHHEAVDSSCANGPCVVVLRREMDHRAPAFVIGADVPLRVYRALWISGVVRYHILSRGSVLAQATVLVPWQFEWQSSSRFSLGVDIRIGR